MKKLLLPVLVLALSVVSAAFGHVSVAPTQSKKGATETYTLRVPSEGGRTTSSVSLTVPDGVTIISVAVPKDGGSVAYQRKAAGTPDEVVWTIEIKPGAAAQLSFTATNSADAASITWKVLQKYTDGSTPSWTPATKLDEAGAPASAPAQKSESH